MACKECYTVHSAVFHAYIMVQINNLLSVSKLTLLYFLTQLHIFSHEACFYFSWKQLLFQSDLVALCAKRYPPQIQA